MPSLTQTYERDFGSDGQFNRKGKELRVGSDRPLGGTSRIVDFHINDEDAIGQIFYMPKLYSSPKWHILKALTGAVVVQEINSGFCFNYDKEKLRLLFSNGTFAFVPERFRV